MRTVDPVRTSVAAGLTPVLGLLAIALAFDAGRARDASVVGTQVSPFGHHLHAPTRDQLRLAPSVTPPEAGTMLPGEETITHLRRGRDAKVGGAGGGRAIYTGVTAFEPTLGIDEQGRIFYQGFASSTVVEGAYRSLKPIVVVSRDDGGSWEEVTPQTHTHSQDPYLYVDARTGRAFTADVTLPCTTVSHTDDVGRSWVTSEACGVVDHQTVFAGPPVSSPTVGYPNIVYMCAADWGVGVYSTATSCLKSLDGGIAWMETGAPPYNADPRQGEGTADVPGLCDGATGHGLVDSNGVVYLPKGWCGQPYLAISKDEGATWERIQVAVNGMPEKFDNEVCVGACVEGWVSDHEAALAIDGSGNIFYFWIARDRLPYLAVSRDGGESFSKPIRVGPPGLKEAFGPAMDAGDDGKVALAYVGSTNAPGGEAPDGKGPEYSDSVTWNGYITTSLDALSDNPRFFTTSVNATSDPIVRGACSVIRCSEVGDFIDVVIGPEGTPWASLVDVCPPPGNKCSEGPGTGWGFVGTVVGGPKLR